MILLGVSIFAYQKGWLKQHPFSQQIEAWQEEGLENLDLKQLFQATKDDKNVNLNELSNDAGDQIKVLSERALEAGQVAKDFVEGSVKVDESAQDDKKISEKAFEYGQYIYCQAVVDDWHEQHQSVETNSNTEEVEF